MGDLAKLESAMLAGVRKMADAGESYAFIGAQLGISHAEARNLCRRHGIKKGRAAPGSDTALRNRREAARKRKATLRRKARATPKPRRSRPAPPSPPPDYRPSPRRSPEPMGCRVCGRGTVPQRVALVQLGEHPGRGHVWPRCRACIVAVERHVAGLKRAAERARARADARMTAVGEGW